MIAGMLSSSVKRALTSHRRFFTTTMAAANSKDRTNLIPFSSRLKQGRALAEDVWSIFKYGCSHITLWPKRDAHNFPQRREPPLGLYQSWTRLHELPPSIMG